MNILELRTEKERTLFTISLVVSIIFWAALILGTLGIGLFYIAAAAGGVLIAQALFLAALKSNGVKITREQLPELYARIETAAERLQLREIPEAYLLNERGFFNAFATRFLGRDFVVLYAELLEACDENDGSIDFIIGHELGHLALQHVKLAPVLLPSKMVPLLGAAYSRAREYSCDRAGTVAAQNPDAAVAGLAVLAAGARYAKRVNVEQFLDQREVASGFWAGVVELGMSHPYLPKRMAAILMDTKPEMGIQKVERNIASYFVAPFLGAGGGAGAGMVALVMIVGIGAAVAVPAMMRFKDMGNANAARFEAADRDAMRQAEELREAAETRRAIEAAAAAAAQEEEDDDDDSAEAAREAQRQLEILQRQIAEQAAKQAAIEQEDHEQEAPPTIEPARSYSKKKVRAPKVKKERPERQAPTRVKTTRVAPKPSSDEIDY